MTQAFLSKCCIDESACTVETYEKLDILESAIDCIGSGVLDQRVVSSATAYTHSIIYEILDNVKEFLVQLAQRVLSVFNNYYLNNVKLLDKYREYIMDKLPTFVPVRHETYEYPIDKNYPKALKSTVAVERDIIKLQEEILGNPNMSSSDVSYRVDLLLEQFGHEVLGAYPDTYDLQESTSKIVREHIRGRKITIDVTRATLDEYITTISTYKKDKEDIQRTRKNIIEDYEVLKRTYSKVTKDRVNLSRGNLRDNTDPEKTQFMNNEYQRYSNIHVEMMRLFNGYIEIYKAAFDTKLNELQDKVNDRKNFITELLTRTGMFASLNTKTMDANKSHNKPIPYQPNLKL